MYHMKAKVTVILSNTITHYSDKNFVLTRDVSYCPSATETRKYGTQALKVCGTRTREPVMSGTQGTIERTRFW